MTAVPMVRPGPPQCDLCENTATVVWQHTTCLAARFVCDVHDHDMSRDKYAADIDVLVITCWSGRCRRIEPDDLLRMVIT